MTIKKPPRARQAMLNCLLVSVRCDTLMSRSDSPSLKSRTRLDVGFTRFSKKAMSVSSSMPLIPEATVAVRLQTNITTARWQRISPSSSLLSN